MHAYTTTQSKKTSPTSMAIEKRPKSERKSLAPSSPPATLAIRRRIYTNTHERSLKDHYRKSPCPVFQQKNRETEKGRKWNMISLGRMLFLEEREKRGG